jgi:hypothetical protein
MTQALNLANFANNLNTSGATTNSGLQNSSVTVTAGTGMSGGGAVALGSSVTLTNAGVTSIVAGTGISISGATGAVTVTNSQPGAVSSVNGATGAIVTTTLYALGSFVTGRPQDTNNYNVDATIAGSSLYTIGPGLIWNGGNWFWIGGGAIASGTVPAVGTGSWRCVSPCVTGPSSNYCNGLWVRYA